MTTTTAPYPLVARDKTAPRTVVTAGGVPIGAREVVVIAGPCAVESETQLLAAARAAKKAGARMLRGGAFKPRTSPYAFRGLREAGLELLAAVRAECGLPVVTEVMDASQLERVCACADMVQIGSRNMQNYTLLDAAGQCGRPVLLKRGMSATIEEFLNAAEYVAHAGNDEIVLCERGIRTFETSARFTLDVSAVPVLQQRSRLPVIVDPSHAAGAAWLVPALARAAVAVGADGLLIEIHPRPAAALCDGQQALTPEAFGRLMGEVRSLAAVLGRRV